MNTKNTNPLALILIPAFLTLICVFCFAALLFVPKSGKDSPDVPKTSSIPAKNTSADSEDTQQLYGIGSVSKIYCTAAVMKLVEQGKVDLDSPVTEYLPEFTMADDRYRQITVRMLLNHTSGLMGTTSANSFLIGYSDFPYQESVLESLKAQTLKADPGAYGVYCNDGFTLAEMIVERVSGSTLAEYLDGEFYSPLGLTDTKMPSGFTESDTTAALAEGGRSLAFENIKSLGAGGIYSTPEDVCLFAGIFTDSGKGILSDASLAAMANPEYKNDTICVQENEGIFGYGLGWDSVDAPIFSEFGLTALTKGGDTMYQHTGLTVIPDQNLSACVTSVGGMSIYCQMLAQEILREVLIADGMEPAAETAAAPTAPVETEIPPSVKQYAGYYASGEMWKAEFTQNNTLLLTSLENDADKSQEYIYEGEGTFRSVNGGYISSYGTLMSASGGIYGTTRLRFSTEPNGKSYLLGTTQLHAPNGVPVSVTMPMAEKTEENPLSGEVLRAWEKRDGSKYYLISENANSIYYLKMPSFKIEMLERFPGYTQADTSVKNCRILDENTAVCRLELPVVLGRDLADVRFYEENGAEYLTYNGFTLVREDAVKSTRDLSGRIPATSAGGWYAVDSADTGRRLEITVPQEGAYYVYDKNDRCTASSVFTDEMPYVLLPENGRLLLTGGGDGYFEITAR